MFQLFKEMNLKRVALAIFFAAFRVVGMLAIPTLTANIIDYGVVEGDMQYIVNQGLIMIGVTLLAIAGAIVGVYFTATESQRLGQTLRNKIFKKIVNFTNEDLDGFGTSSLITRSSNDTMQIQFVMYHMIYMLGLDPMLIIGASIMALIREPRLAAVFIITIPVLILAIGFILKKAHPIFRSLQKKTDVLNRIFREGLTGVRVVRAFKKDQYEIDRFDEANEDFMETSIKGQTVAAFFMPTLLLVGSATSILIIWFGAQLVGQEVMQVGNMVAFLTYASLIIVGIMLIASVLAFLPRGSIAAERVMEVINTESTIEDVKEPVTIPDGPVQVTYDQVDFRYPGAEKLALDQIDFQIDTGETLAVIGGTGAGKSTLANLLVRMYDVTDGSVAVNGIDIREVRQRDLRHKIGFAPQDAVLFSGTIRDNLTYGKPDATDADIWEALEIAQGANFVRELNAGLDGKVEHGGGNFSGGQRQRLSIARALVTDADILVFDDSFSALDFKTDANLRAALKSVTEDKVVIIIAQRISTVADADTIVVLDDGRMVGRGTHEALKATNDVYQEIMNSQMKGEEL